jgi:hypothetical protein
MTNWKKELQRSMQTPDAQAYVAKENALYTPFITNVVTTLSTKKITSTVTSWKVQPAIVAEFESYETTESTIVETLWGPTPVTETIKSYTVKHRLERNERDVVKHTETTRVPLTQGSVAHLNEIRAKFCGAVYTTDLVLTKAQINMLDQWNHMDSERKVYCSLVNTKTGATALLLRDNIDVYVLQENGVCVRSLNVPNFAALTWHFDTRAKRGVTLVMPAKVKAIMHSGGMTINRYSR